LAMASIIETVPNPTLAKVRDTDAARSGGSIPSLTTSVSNTSSSGNTYYVAPNGSDSNSCSQAQNIITPRKTVAAGIQCLSAGDTLYLRAGTYTSGAIDIHAANGTASGAPGSPITIQ